MKYYDVDKQKVLESLETSEDGLSSDEAKARLTRYGANKLKETNKKSNISKFFDQFKDISDKIYQGKPPMFNILDSLNKIKSESSLNESLKLDLFLTTCLQRRVAHDLKNPNLTQDDINIRRFQCYQ